MMKMQISILAFGEMHYYHTFLTTPSKTVPSIPCESWIDNKPELAYLTP